MKYLATSLRLLGILAFTGLTACGQFHSEPGNDLSSSTLESQKVCGYIRFVEGLHDERFIEDYKSGQFYALMSTQPQMQSLVNQIDEATDGERVCLGFNEVAIEKNRVQANPVTWIDVTAFGVLEGIHPWISSTSLPELYSINYCGEVSLKGTCQLSLITKNSKEICIESDVPEIDSWIQQLGTNSEGMNLCIHSYQKIDYQTQGKPTLSIDAMNTKSFKTQNKLWEEDL